LHLANTTSIFVTDWYQLDYVHARRTTKKTACDYKLFSLDIINIIF